MERWRAAMEDRGMRVSRLKTEYLKLRVDLDGGVDKEIKTQGKF